MVSLVVELFVFTVVGGFDVVVLWRYLLVGLVCFDYCCFARFCLVCLCLMLTHVVLRFLRLVWVVV